MSSISEKLTTVLIGVVLVGIVFGIVAAGSAFAQDTADAGSAAQSVPFNVTLDQDNIQSIVSVSNGTVALDANNYTEFLSDGLLQMDDNTSWTGTATITFAYRQSSWISSTVVVVLLAALVLITVALGLKAIGKGKGER